jgi:hypothetical protein
MEGYAAGRPAASGDAGLAVLVSELTGLVGELAGAGPAAASFDEIEQLVMVRGRELLRKVIQHVMDDLPRAFRTADLWLIHAADCCSRYSSWTCCGVRY